MEAASEIKPPHRVTVKQSETATDGLEAKSVTQIVYVAVRKSEKNM
jgi:hypothetical protein